MNTKTEQAKHTIGPWGIDTWSYENGKHTKLVIQNKQDAVAQVWELYRPGEDYEMAEQAMRAEMDANARLIAAAPEMYEALTEMVSLYRLAESHGVLPEWDDLDRQIEDIREVIAKAEGR